MKLAKIFLFGFLIVFLAFVGYYVLLIPINLGSLALWFFIAFLFFALGVADYGFNYFFDEDIDNEYIPLFLVIFATLIVVVCLLTCLFTSSMFLADSYKNITTIEEGSFAEDIPGPTETDIMDINTAINLGSRVMGEIDNVSQYVISDEYNMIIYQGKTYRVSPLLYSSFSKAIGNNGISGYVLVDCGTQEAKLVQLDEKIMYSPSAIFGHNLKRHVFSKYNTSLLGKEQFEIDDDGTPYYIVPTYRNTIGIFFGKVLDKVLVVNAINGNIDEYTIDNLPEWIDHADSVDHLVENVQYVYKYVNGFFNTMFAQKDVKTLSYFYADSIYIGYSSIKTNNGIEYFTGVTSINNDESNLGFVFLNPRTGKTKFYSCVGAEESSAQASAEALVQNYGYTASYPFVVNVDGIETYLIALKDKTGTNKAYSFVNVENYTIATQAPTKEEALKLYQNAIKNKADINNNNANGNNKISGKILEIYTATENATTYFYYKLEGYDELFVSSILNNRRQLLLKVGDTIEAEVEAVNDYYNVISINF